MFHCILFTLIKHLHFLYCVRLTGLIFFHIKKIIHLCRISLQRKSVNFRFCFGLAYLPATPNPDTYMYSIISSWPDSVLYHTLQCMMQELHEIIVRLSPDKSFTLKLRIILTKFYHWQPYCVYLKKALIIIVAEKRPQSSRVRPSMFG